MLRSCSAAQIDIVVPTVGFAACQWIARGSVWHSVVVPRKIRQLVADIEQAGFVRVPGGKGSHRKFRHPKLSGSVVLSGGDGDDAKEYQEKQVKNAIREAGK